MLTGVSTVWDTEAKVKVEALQQMITEVVSLYHAEVVQWPVSNCEFHPNWRKQKEEGLRCYKELVCRCYLYCYYTHAALVQKF